eukprot:TRINITY_DN36603_c0_g1_i1.p1 TRINITY_DN36603_c0_g1~~TRINITY_DN36603_c0_g1_i1.p1  ORF type:complete len:750 (+),score=94.88 TRINITY_DN36603_c0_g1_i1:313-2250(+)
MHGYIRQTTQTCDGKSAQIAASSSDEVHSKVHTAWEASYGALEELAGTWEGVKGWNVLCVPAMGKPSHEREGCKVIVQNYWETLSFTKMEDQVLNSGGTMDQLMGCLEYEQKSYEFETNTLLHSETGIWYHTDNVKSNDPSQRPWKVRHQYARSATNFHGATVLMMGDLTHRDAKEGHTLGQDDIADVSTLPMLTPVPESYMALFKPHELKWSTYDIVTKQESKMFNVINPNENLRRDNNGLRVLSSKHFHMCSRNYGRIVNVPFLEVFAKATRVQADFWLQKVELPMSGETFDQLQYSQVIDIEFVQKIDGVERMVTFPHVTTNTMRRKLHGISHGKTAHAAASRDARLELQQSSSELAPRQLECTRQIDQRPSGTFTLCRASSKPGTSDASKQGEDLQFSIYKFSEETFDVVNAPEDIDWSRWGMLDDRKSTRLYFFSKDSNTKLYQFIQKGKSFVYDEGAASYLNFTGLAEEAKSNYIAMLSTPNFEEVNSFYGKPLPVPSNYHLFMLNKEDTDHAPGTMLYQYITSRETKNFEPDGLTSDKFRVGSFPSDADWSRWTINYDSNRYQLALRAYVISAFKQGSTTELYQGRFDRYKDGENDVAVSEYRYSGNVKLVGAPDNVDFSSMAAVFDGVQSHYYFRKC